MANWTKYLSAAALPVLLLGTAAIAQTQQQYAQPQYQGQPLQVAFTDPANVPNDLARIDNALNGTASFSGRFTQYGADGSVSSGQIFLNRPGKMRFEYDAPNPLLIVSDGVTLTQVDKALETSDRVPLSATPLNYFLKENVKLERDTEVIGLTKNSAEISVTAQDGSGEIDGAITMVFDAPSMNLKAWSIADSFGGETRVLLSNLKYNQRLDPRLFVLRDDSRRDRRRR